MKELVYDFMQLFEITESMTLVEFLNNSMKLFIACLLVLGVFKMLTELLKIFVDWRFYK